MLNDEMCCRCWERVIGTDRGNVYGHRAKFDTSWERSKSGLGTFLRSLTRYTGPMKLSTSYRINLNQECKAGLARDGKTIQSTVSNMNANLLYYNKSNKMRREENP